MEIDTTGLNNWFIKIFTELKDFVNKSLNDRDKTIELLQETVKTQNVNSTSTYKELRGSINDMCEKQSDFESEIINSLNDKLSLAMKSNKHNIDNLNKLFDDKLFVLEENISKLDSTLSKEMKSKNNEISKLQGELDELKTDVSKAANSLKGIELISRKIESVKSISKSELEAVRNEVCNLKKTISSIKLSRIDILRAIQENGNIDLAYNFILSPRVLPDNPKEGLLMIDAKDNELKYFTKGKWTKHGTR